MSDTLEPRVAFEDSRRLTGPNRWFDGTAVLLSALTSALRDAEAHGRWKEHVKAMARALGWPAPRPTVHPHAQGVFLVFAAPEATLLTATEVNEWAWEQSLPLTARQGIELAHLHVDAGATFTQRAASEASRPLLRLRAAASARQVPVFADDDSVSLGAGSGHVAYPRALLPLAMDVPWARLHDVPKALVTGSNGKTTVVRLLAAMATATGHEPGLASTEGILISGEPVEQGDYSGPAGARAVLRDARVTLAVLETARGGIARRGLAVHEAEVAVVTNISADHFGEYGIDSEDDIAELKLTVAHAVNQRGLLVLNADDAVLMAAAQRLPHAAAARLALFAANHDAPALTALRETGGATCGVRAGQLVLTRGGTEHDLGAVADLPLAVGGAAAYNVMNLAAAALAAVAGLGLPVDAVRATVQRFGADPHDNPGRLERWAHRGATLLIDYAHNPEGLARLLAVARALPHQRLLLLLGQAGNRDDSAIAALAHTAAAAQPDLVIVKELPAMLRGRTPGEVPALLMASMRSAGLDPAALQLGGDESEAAAALLAAARAGDMVVMPLHSTDGRLSVAAALDRG